jgi:hypothetical protein
MALLISKLSEEKVCMDGVGGGGYSYVMLLYVRYLLGGGGVEVHNVTLRTCT